MGLIDFNNIHIYFYILWKSMATVNCLDISFKKYLLLFSTEETHTGLEKHEGEKDIIFIFG